MHTITECPHRHEGNCKIASVLAKGLPVPTSEESCGICIRSDRPRTLNGMTCQLAYAVTKDPELKSIFAKAHNIRANRPGSCLRDIFRDLGVSEGESCQCDEFATIMDVWGTEGCHERIPEIVNHLNSQAVSWFDMVKIALGGYLTTESLVNEAIKRSAVEEINYV